MHWIQPPVPPLPEGTSLSGKTVVVTGASAGLGLEAARQFLQYGASTLVLAVRNATKGHAARTTILADPIVQRTNPSPNVLVYELDLSSHDSVIAFARKITAELPELNILLLNAGMNLTSWTWSPSTHYEMLFQVNVLSNALLSIFLLPLLQSSAQISGSPSRIAFVGSQGQDYSTLVHTPIPASTPLFDFINNPLLWKPAYRYADSKFLLSIWARVFAAHVNMSEVTVNIMCPGIVYTGLNANTSLLLRATMYVVSTFLARSLEDGGRTMVYAAAVVGEESHGMMIVNNEIVK
jgi:NAD(P)-dependent dehydrogenase (short-subunit alcohol dehydrogenase family)